MQQTDIEIQAFKSGMTWKEIKKAIEAQGVQDDMEIDYIDISQPDFVVWVPSGDEVAGGFGLTIKNQD